MTAGVKFKARELEILRLIATGFSNGEIGAQLHLSNDTVRWYNKQIFQKLGANNRTQAVARARESGLLAGADSTLATPASLPPRVPVHYVANRDVHIAYQVIGQGPVDLLFVHGFLSHLELAWENSEFASFFEQLSGFARVILFDKRGVGLSDRVQSAPTLEHTIEDACCVLDAVGSKRAFVMGTSEGGAAAALLASTYPERVLGLILYGVLAKGVQTGGEPTWAPTENDLEELIGQIKESWGGPWAIESFAPSRAQDAQFRGWWAMLLRAASSPSSVQAVLSVLRAVDIRPLLPHIRVNTLVLHKTLDRIVDVQAGRYFAANMPNSAWVELPGADHIYFVESAALLSAVKQFCQSVTSPASKDTWIAVILCATANRGLSSGSDASSEISAYRPKHLTLTGSEIIALFDSPTRAIHCALGLQRTTNHRSLKISLHIGECNVRDGKPTDAALRIAQHAVAACAPGEIVLTRTLHDILAGSEFEFHEQRDGHYLLLADGSSTAPFGNTH